jgi:hypothetical protein
VAGFNLIWMWDKREEMSDILGRITAAVAWRPPHVRMKREGRD